MLIKNQQQKIQVELHDNFINKCVPNHKKQTEKLTCLTRKPYISWE